MEGILNCSYTNINQCIIFTIDSIGRISFILAGLWFDISKPTMTTFLNSLVQEFNVLSTRGSVCMCVCVRVCVCAWVCACMHVCTTFTVSFIFSDRNYGE